MQKSQKAIKFKLLPTWLYRSRIQWRQWRCSGVFIVNVEHVIAGWVVELPISYESSPLCPPTFQDLAGDIVESCKTLK